jgi:hypothetical protein
LKELPRGLPPIGFGATETPRRGGTLLRGLFGGVPGVEPQPGLDHEHYQHQHRGRDHGHLDQRR